MADVNTGKPSEDLFLRWADNQKGFVHRFTDLYDAKKKGKAANEQPSDFLLTLPGFMCYAEVKSTTKPSFSFAQIQPKQWKTALKQTKAGGHYLFFVHFLTENRWFRIPARVILDSERKSLNIKTLSQFEFDIQAKL